MLWRISELPEPLRDASLKAFDVRHRGNRIVRDAVVGFLSGSMTTPWLAIVGGFETGKSYLAGCVVRGSVEQGHYALYRYVPNMLRRIKEGFSNGTSAEEYRRLEEPEVLVLDDFGTEEWSPWVVETLSELFEHRYERDKRTFVTTNLSLEKWPEQIGRIKRRIEDSAKCTIVVNNAPRYRGKKG